MVGYHLRTENDMTTKTKKLHDISTNGRLFPGAPTDCFGRSLDSEADSCVGETGKKPPCVHFKNCGDCMLARIRAGVEDPNDLSLPVSYVIPDEYTGKKDKGDIVALPQKWPEQLPVHPSKTTITDKQADRIGKRVAENERQLTKMVFGLALDQGKLLKEVYLGMAEREFSAWCDKYGLSTRRARRYVALHNAMEHQCLTPQDQAAITDHPKMSLNKFELLLDNQEGIDLPTILHTEVEDGYGAKTNVLDMPVSEIPGALSRMKRSLMVQTASQNLKEAMLGDTGSTPPPVDPPPPARTTPRKDTTTKVVRPPFQPASILYSFCERLTEWEKYRDLVPETNPVQDAVVVRDLKKIYERVGNLHKDIGEVLAIIDTPEKLPEKPVVSNGKVTGKAAKTKTKTKPKTTAKKTPAKKATTRTKKPTKRTKKK